VDNTEIGEISNGETKSFNIQEGTHEIVLKIDWCRSNVLAVEVEPDQVVNLECGSSMRNGKLLFAPLYATFWRSSYLWISVVDS
jgi:hypothetical protein